MKGEVKKEKRAAKGSTKGREGRGGEQRGQEGMYIFFSKKEANLGDSYEGIRTAVAQINQVCSVICDMLLVVYYYVAFFVQQFTVSLPHMIANESALLDNKYFYLFTKQKTA